MNTHCYMGIVNVNLNASQKATLVDALRELGPYRSPQPAHVCHVRVRLDGEAVLFEAMFSEDSLTIQAFKNRLGAIFDVDPDTIDHSITEYSFSPGGTTISVTFSKGGTDYLRVALFGGVGCTWEESHAECLGYLAQFKNQWEIDG